MRILNFLCNKSIFILLVIILSGCFPSSNEGNAVLDDKVYTAAQVIDGDTLILNNTQTVRLIGIDTPEIIDDYNRNHKTSSWVKVPVEIIDQYALLSKQRASEWLRGRRVQLKYDPSNIKNDHKDKYGRILAYVYDLEGNDCLNEVLLSEGYALVFRKFDFKLKDRFLDLENKAKENKKGFWQYQK